MNIRAEYVRIIGFSFLSTVLIFAGNNDFILKSLINMKVLSPEINMEKSKMLCSISGIIWATLWLPIEHTLLKTKKIKKDKVFLGLLEYNKERYDDSIKNSLKNRSVQFNTRIFKRQCGILGWWNRNLCNKTILELVTIEGISDKFYHKTLYFEVNKNETQGIVGKCYKTKKLCIDLDLSDNNYSLTDEQVAKIGNINFCSAIPIFGDKSKINFILSVDCSKKINFTQQQQKIWEDHMKIYAAFIDKHINL